MQATADVIVIGGGVMGCAAAYNLAKDGCSVLLLERYTIGHSNGSSHGASRLFRLAHTSTDYVELARSAQLLWRELENESGASLMQQTNGLDIGSPRVLEPFRIALHAAGVPFEVLERDEILRHYPHFNLPEGSLGLLQDSYALLAADRTVAAFATQAIKHGVRFLEGQKVQRIRPARDGVEVSTDQSAYSAGRVIVCAGSWMRPVMKQLGLDLPLTIRKEHITFYMPEDPSLWMPGRFPIFRHHLEGTFGRWGVGFPIFEHRGVKMLVDLTGPFVEADDPDRAPDPALLDQVREYVAATVPSLGNHMLEAETCRYTMTPDDDFILDHHPVYPQVVVASPCSGHGFKFAPLIGRILANLALRGETDYDIERFRLDRPTLTIPKQPGEITKPKA